MANCPVVVVLLLAIVIPFPRATVAISRNSQPTTVEFGTFLAADNTCFFKKIFKGQKSPITFSFQNAGNTVIDYVKIEAASTNYRKGGIAAEIVRGGTGTIAITVQISEGSGKSVFTNDVEVTMWCPAPAG